MSRKILIIMLVTLMIVSVGCTTNTGSNTNDQSTAIKEENNRKSNSSIEEIDEIVMCESFDINTGFVPVFDPYKGWGSFYYLGNFYETLVNYEDGKIKPGLAKSWDVNDNEITFKLREGVKFTDGTDFNAEVVKKNFEMIPVMLQDEYIKSFVILTKVKEIEVVDEYTIKFKLTEPYYGALQEFAMVRPMGIMSPNAYTEDGLSDDIYTKTFGTGKYMIENAVQGEDYTFVRNENYWGEKPKVKKFIVKTIPDMESKIMALRTGEIDLVFGSNNITYDAFSEFQNDDKFFAKSSEDNVMTRCFILNTAKSPFDDKNVRLAVQHAIDKQSICDNLFYGIEEKAEYLFNPDLPYCGVSLKQYTYNTQKAKELLKKSGWLETEGSEIREKSGQRLKAELLYETGMGIEEDMVLTIAEQLKEVGFEIQLTGLEMMAGLGKAMKGDFKIYSTRTYGIPYEPYTDIGSMNKVGYHNPAQQGLSDKKELNLKINKVASMTDKDKIQETYSYILKTLHNEAMYLPISYKKELIIFNKEKIKDYKFNGQPLNIDISGIIAN